MHEQTLALAACNGTENSMQVLRSVNSCADNEMIQFTACTLIHKFSCWLANSAIEDPSLLDLVPELFRHTIHSLGRHMSAGGASLAFAALCRDCTPTVGEKCSQEMLNTFERAASTESANWVREGPAGAAVMPLEEEDICSIIEGTATVLAHAASQGSSEVCSESICGLSSMDGLVLVESVEAYYQTGSTS